MSTTPLRQVLEYFEKTREGVSIRSMAKDLDLSVGQVESMVDYWVRKGRVRSFGVNSENCGSCGTNDHCNLVITLPRSYELVNKHDQNNPEYVDSCQCN